MLINDRVRLIMKANGLSSSEFADKIGVKRSNLSHVLSGRNKPGTDFLAKIVDTFPNVNASWLLTGTQREGDFQEEVQGRSPEKTETKNSVSQTNEEIEKIVLFYKDGTFSVHHPNTNAQ